MPTLIIIAGPTAIGKTKFAIRLAQHLGTEIISCDSRQVYKELRIGVARPTDDELAAAKHHFIACRSVTTPYNVFDYESDALAVTEELFKQHDHVVVAGGSGLYIDALCHGINVMPDPSPELRKTLQQRVANGELEGMLADLERLDPEYFAVVDKLNPIRIQRALEVIITSGQKYSTIISKPLNARPFDIIMVGLHCERDTLRDRIYRRVDTMINEGLVDEVASLLPHRTLNTLNTVGYKELFPVLDNLRSLNDAITDIKNNTWHYAKKQTTWLKRYNNLLWLPADSTPSIAPILSLLK